MSKAKHLAVSIKRAFIFLISVAGILFVYLFLLPDELRTTQVVLSIVLIWAFSAYIVLPRVHRLLSQLYVPNYFIGRTRTTDGILGDPVNLGILGTEKDLRKALVKAGWVEAEPLNLGSTWKMIKTTLRGEDYPNAPFSSLLLFDRKQDLAFQKQVDGNPRKRHHVRFWKTPDNWYLPGGYESDWVAAASYDDAVGFSLFTLQFTHKIDPDVDQERNFLVKTLKSTGMVKSKQKIEHFFPNFITRNGGGDKVISDGSMVILSVEKKETLNS